MDKYPAQLWLYKVRSIPLDGTERLREKKLKRRKKKEKLSIPKATTDDVNADPQYCVPLEIKHAGCQSRVSLRRMHTSNSIGKCRGKGKVKSGHGGVYTYPYDESLTAEDILTI